MANYPIKFQFALFKIKKINLILQFFLITMITRI